MRLKSILAAGVAVAPSASAFMLRFSCSSWTASTHKSAATHDKHDNRICYSRLNNTFMSTLGLCHAHISTRLSVEMRSTPPYTQTT